MSRGPRFVLKERTTGLFFGRDKAGNITWVPDSQDARPFPSRYAAKKAKGLMSTPVEVVPR